MLRFADTNQCRMSTLVRHFGDLADGQTACGICDFCDPAGCTGQRFRSATEEELATIFRVLEVLRSGDQKSTGKLHTGLFPGSEMSRDSFEEVLGAMARAGVARLSEAVFEKDGKQIPYRTVGLTPAGRAVNKTTPINVLMKDTSAPSKKRKRKKKAPTSPKQKTRTRAKAPRVPKRKRSPTAAASSLEGALRTWRLLEAKRRGLPAFRIFSDQTLRAIAQVRPGKAAELIAIPGIGASSVQKYGQQIYQICQTAGAEPDAFA
jgi:superfamily II DNA helicase RecQ